MILGISKKHLQDSSSKAQNHGFAVDQTTLPGQWVPLMVNANDGTNEGAGWFESEVMVETSQNEMRESRSIAHRIHVWYIYLREWLIFMVNVGKYTIHGSYGKWDERI